MPNKKQTTEKERKFQDQGPHYLYRYFDKDGKLLYVGISFNAYRRMNGHEEKAWFNQIASMTVEEFETRELALTAERRAIQSEKPIHNIVWNNADQLEAFKPEECGKELAGISINCISVNHADVAVLEARRDACLICHHYRDECSSKCFSKINPVAWFLDLEKTGQTIHRNGIDYTQFRGVDCYGQIVAIHVAADQRPANVSRIGATEQVIFCTYRAT